MNTKIISAGAGSGKTYRLSGEMVEFLKSGVRPAGIIATTFTQKAAAELEERVRIRLLEEGLTQQADELSNALIGTVHALGVKLLKRFAFEAGVSPEVDIIAGDDQQVMFNKSLAVVLTLDHIAEMEQLNERLGLNKRGWYDWRREVKLVADAARANNVSLDVLQKSKDLSVKSLQSFLGEVSGQNEDTINRRLQAELENTISIIESNDDKTKVTQNALNDCKSFYNRLKLSGKLNWYEWAKISKLKPGAKSREDFVTVQEMAAQADRHPGLHRDIEAFIGHIFNLASEALVEYSRYKKQRGLIDYIDMETMVTSLLDHQEVKAILSREIDLLMVDEFQDTSPIQLEIFLKLSRIASYSVWVGDPKQSIYGFRGADPRLMEAIIQATGGIRKEDIQVHSWRSREDLVYAANALFTKAFAGLPEEQIALRPKRTNRATPESINSEDEPPEVGLALNHWHFKLDEGGKTPGRPWYENALAQKLYQYLESGALILPKGEKKYRAARPGDVAILCRSNAECRYMAEALHRTGLQAAFSRVGLLQTAEIKLILACLKVVLNKEDSLSVAEILKLALHKSLKQIITERKDFLERSGENETRRFWGHDEPVIRQLHELRPKVADLSSSEILNLVLEELDLRRIILSWGLSERRLANVDMLRKLSLQYEEACNRMHAASSLGGFLLWLATLEDSGEDEQAAGSGPEAVNVLTYHRSKGLEWPVVICFSLEGNLKGDVFGLHFVAEKEEVDLDNILGHRWLRYWIKPYSDQMQNTSLNDRLMSSDIQLEARQKALAEEARLLYVGITRARDYLIIPSRDRSLKWLNRVWSNGDEDIPTLLPDSYETPWTWAGKVILINTETLLFPRNFTDSPPQPQSVSFFSSPAGKKYYTPYQIDLHEEHWESYFSHQIRQQFDIKIPSFPATEKSAYQNAKLLKAFVTADHMEYTKEQRREMAEGHLERFDIDMPSEELVEFSSSFHEFLKDGFQFNKMLRKYPIRYHYNQRLFETVVDFILLGQNDVILIQNSGLSGENKKFPAKISELTPWLHLSKLALNSLFGNKRIRLFVNFVLKGVVVEVETQQTKLMLAE